MIRLSAEMGRYECLHPVSNNNHPPTSIYFRPCGLTSSKGVNSLVSSDQILVQIIVSLDIGLARRTLKLR